MALRRLCLGQIPPSKNKEESAREHYLNTTDFRLASQNSKFYRPIRTGVVSFNWTFTRRILKPL